MRKKTDTIAGQITYSKLLGAIKSGQIKPVYLFYGEESFLINDLIKQLKLSLLDAQATELDYSVYDGDGSPGKIDWVKLRTELQTPPFLSTKRVVLVKNSGLFKGAVNLPNEQSEALEACLGHQASWACLIFKEDKPDNRTKKLLARVKEAGEVAELGRMDMTGLMNWIAANLRRFGLRISKQAAESLIDRCESDLSLLSNEVNKLRLYAESAHLDALGQEEIDLICVPDLRGTIFDLTDALAQNDAGKALKLYRQLRQNKEAAVFILFMLARHIKQLACAHDAGQERLLEPVMKLPPFALRRLIQQSRHFDAEQLAKMYALCRTRDNQIKWGKMNEDIALESLVVSLASSLR